MKLNIKIPENIKERITGLTDRQRQYIFIGLLGFIFIAGCVFFVFPQMSKLAQVRQDITKLREDLKKAKTDIRMVPQYRTETRRVAKSVNRMEAKLKSREEVPFILERIARHANANGVKIDQIVPDMEAQAQVLKEGGRTFYRLPVTIKAESGYHEFGRFLNNAELGEIFINVSEFTLTATSSPKKHLLEIVLSSVIYENNE